MNNLFIGYNSIEDFKILICAPDKDAAYKVANEYANDSHFRGEFCISSYEMKDEVFDCDYVVI